MRLFVCENHKYYWKRILDSTRHISESYSHVSYSTSSYSDLFDPSISIADILLQHTEDLAPLPLGSDHHISSSCLWPSLWISCDAEALNFIGFRPQILFALYPRFIVLELSPCFLKNLCVLADGESEPGVSITKMCMQSRW